MHQWPQNMLISVPVADLRREPHSGGGTYDSDPHQESQLLFGEHVVVFEEFGDWLRVEAPEQQKFNVQTSLWQGYLGWVRKDHVISLPSSFIPNVVVKDLWTTLHQTPYATSPVLLSVSLGTRLVSDGSSQGWYRIRLPDGRHAWCAARALQTFQEIQKNFELARQEIIAAAEHFLGAPYFWGGKSAYRPDWKEPLTSVDCSGLTHLCYRVQGISIPRDAHDQYLKTQRVNGHSLKSADLVFFAKPERPERMTHVMLYAGNNELLEATACVHQVRRIPIVERLGKPLEEIINGEVNGQYAIYFGAHIPYTNVHHC